MSKKDGKGQIEQAREGFGIYEPPDGSKSVSTSVTSGLVALETGSKFLSIVVRKDLAQEVLIDPDSEIGISHKMLCSRKFGETDFNESVKNVGLDISKEEIVGKKMFLQIWKKGSYKQYGEGLIPVEKLDERQGDDAGDLFLKFSELIIMPMKDSSECVSATLSIASKLGDQHLHIFIPKDIAKLCRIEHETPIILTHTTENVKANGQDKVIGKQMFIRVWNADFFGLSKADEFVFIDDLKMHDKTVEIAIDVPSWAGNYELLIKQVLEGTGIKVDKPNLRFCGATNWRVEVDPVQWNTKNSQLIYDRIKELYEEGLIRGGYVKPKLLPISN